MLFVTDKKMESDMGGQKEKPWSLKTTVLADDILEKIRARKN